MTYEMMIESFIVITRNANTTTSTIITSCYPHIMFFHESDR